MQAIHRVLWRSNNSSDVGFTYVDDDNKRGATGGLDLAGTPAIVSRSHGIAVGMLVDDYPMFGLVTSSITDRTFVTAWRAAQLLPYARTIRHADGKFDSTLDRLVTVAAGSCNRDLLSSLANDFNCTSSDDFFDLLVEVGTWPSSNDLVDVWGLLSYREQRDLVPVLRAAIDTGAFDASSALTDRIETAERRMASAAKSLGQLAAKGIHIRS